MEGRAIRVRDAHIKTAAVEIKSLTVSGKQVTMGVFRQLKTEPVIDPESAELLGVPWGTVNYFPKPCESDHLHVVWQKGDELRRACVYEPPRGGSTYIARLIGSAKSEPEGSYRALIADRQISRMYERGFAAWVDCVYDGRYKEADELLERYLRHYGELASLDQLFIAV